MLETSALGLREDPDRAGSSESQKQIESALLEGEHRFRILADAMPQLVWVSAPDGQVEFVNEQWFLYTGRPRGPVDRNAWLGTVHPDDRARVIERHETAVRSQSDFKVEYRIRRHDGEFRWHLARTIFIKDKTGAPIKRFGTATDIHDQKLFAKYAAEAKEQFEIALEGFTDGFVMFDREWHYLFANEKWLKFTQKTLEEIKGKTIWEMAPHMVNTPFHEKLQSSMMNREGTRFDCYSKTLKKWLEIRTFPTASGISVFSTDIHARKMAEERLKTSQGQLEVVMQGVGSGILAYDRSGNYIFANDLGAQMSGYPTAQDFLNAPRSEIFGKLEILDENGHPFDLGQLPSARLLRGETDVSEVVVQYRRKGSDEVKWSILRAQAVRDDRGEIQMVVTIFKDFTDRKRSELEKEKLHKEVLRREEAASFLDEASQILSSSLDYRKTLNSIAELAIRKLSDWCSIFVVEEDGPASIAVTHPDPKMRELAEEFRRKYPEDWESNTSTQAQVLRTGQSILVPSIEESQIEVAAKDEEHLRMMKSLRISSLLVIPIQTAGKTLGVLTLISSRQGRFGEDDRRIAEELGRRAGLAIENARHFEQAQNAIRMRDEFLSIASHELKTPLTSLKLQAQMTARRLASHDPALFDPANIEKLFRMTSNQVDRLIKLVDDMLDISRITHGKLSFHKEEVDLGALVRDVTDRFEGQLKSQGCRHRLTLETSVVGLWDRYRIEQVITNLITNAMKYASGKPIEISVTAEGKFAVLKVKDQGIGIDSQSQQRIFQRFERAVSATNVSGLGLGLYISKQIVEAHEGRITVESEIGKGSTFVVELPLAQEVDPV